MEKNVDNIKRVQSFWKNLNRFRCFFKFLKLDSLQSFPLYNI